MHKDSWPSFLDKLDSDPDKAFRELYVYLRRFVFQHPLKEIRELCEEQKEKMVYDLAVYYVKDDFEKLRKYKNMGYSFGVWIEGKAKWLATDEWRRKKRIVKTTPIEPVPIEDGETRQFDPPSPNPGPDSITENSDLLGAVKKALAGMGNYCRVLIRLHSHDFTPKEISRALRLLKLKPRTNDQVSVDLYRCKLELREQLSEMGIDCPFEKGARDGG